MFQPIQVCNVRKTCLLRFVFPLSVFQSGETFSAGKTSIIPSTCICPFSSQAKSAEARKHPCSDLLGTEPRTEHLVPFPARNFVNRRMKLPSQTGTAVLISPGADIPLGVVPPGVAGTDEFLNKSKRTGIDGNRTATGSGHR